MKIKQNACYKLVSFCNVLQYEDSIQPSTSKARGAYRKYTPEDRASIGWYPKLFCHKKPNSYIFNMGLHCWHLNIIRDSKYIGSITLYKFIRLSLCFACQNYFKLSSNKMELLRLLHVSWKRMYTCLLYKKCHIVKQVHFYAWKKCIALMLIVDL